MSYSPQVPYFSPPLHIAVAQRRLSPHDCVRMAPPATTMRPTPYISAVTFPSLRTLLFFKSAYNIQVITEENELEERLLNRFRKEIFRAGILQECRFFKNVHDKRKRKSREAARRDCKRSPQPKAPTKGKHETTDSKDDDKG